MTTGYSTSLSTSSKTRRPKRSWRGPCWHSSLTEIWLSTRGRASKWTGHTFPLMQRPSLSVWLREWTSWLNQQGALDTSACVAGHYFVRAKWESSDGGDYLPPIPSLSRVFDGCKTPSNKSLLAVLDPYSWVKKLISPLSSILSKIIKFMCVRGLNRSLRRSVSLLLSAPTTDSLGRV